MSKAAVVRARIQPEVKVRMERVLDSLGISVSEAISTFCSQVVLQRGLPFPVCLPNQATMDAMKEADSRKGRARFSSARELFKDLDI